LKIKIAVEQFDQSFLAHSQLHVELDEQATGIIGDRSRVVYFPKGSFIMQEGTVSKVAYFILGGRARSYYTDSQGKVITWLFYFNEPYSDTKNLFINDYSSLLKGANGTLTIEALTEVKAIQWRAEDVEYLVAHVPQFEKWMRKVNEHFVAVLYGRISTLLTLSASERYVRLMSDEPHLRQMFSNKLVASYVNVAPQSLSRIKRILIKSPLHVPYI
jgi:CRP-like cAMP-binding protein